MRSTPRWVQKRWSSMATTASFTVWGMRPGRTRTRSCSAWRVVRSVPSEANTNDVWSSCLGDSRSSSRAGSAHEAVTTARAASRPARRRGRAGPSGRVGLIRMIVPAGGGRPW